MDTLCDIGFDVLAWMVNLPGNHVDVAVGVHANEQIVIPSPRHSQETTP